MDPRVKAVLAMVGNGVMLAVAVWPLAEHLMNEQPVKAYAWRLLARASGYVAEASRHASEACGNLNLTAQKRYYEEIQR